MITERIKFTFVKGVNTDGVESIKERYEDYKANYLKDGEKIFAESIVDTGEAVELTLMITADEDDVDIIVSDFTQYENIMTEVL